MLFRATGLPAPTWRGEIVPFSMLVLSYPLALGLIVWGFGRYWTAAGIDRAFLSGWALGCLALTLAGPFFPYAVRGTMTLQIPLFTMAAAIWFDRRPRVGWKAAVVVVLLLGSTTVTVVRREWNQTDFDPAEMHKWLNPAQRELISILSDRAERNDVLVADQPNLRWIAPDYPGLHYAGHFFLTVAYQRKLAEQRAFYASATDEERRRFLDERNVRWLFVDDDHDMAQFAFLRSVRLIAETPVGSLLEVDPSGGSGER